MLKKTVSVLTALCLIFCALSVNVFAAYQDNVAKYDYNGDGTVSLLDARALLKISAGIEQPKDSETYPNLVYDLDGDGVITNKDVVKILYIVTGIEPDVISDKEYQLELFKQELNRVKSEKPGFKKSVTNHCTSMLVTTENSGLSSLDVKNMEFDKYVDKVCDVMKMFPGTSEYTKALKEQAENVYKPSTSESVLKKNVLAVSSFPVNNLGKSCYLTVDDIADIVTRDDGDYIYREVTMKTDTYTGTEYPTGSAGFSQRWQKISYGKVFNIPSFDTTQNGETVSILNKVTFKDGKITVKVDKLTGMPLSVDYSYTYVADLAGVPDSDSGMTMSTVTTMNVSENYVINPVEVN